MYQIEKIRNKILCGDTLLELKKFPDECVDMILTDPPYGISSEVKITRGRNRMKFKGPDIILKFGDWDIFDSLEMQMKWTFQWIDECVRILKKGRIFATWFDKDKINFISHYLQRKHKFKIKGYFAHLKSNPVPQARKVKWMNGWEIIGLWQKPGGKLVYNYHLGQQKDYMIVPIVGGKERTNHPTQKPEKIVAVFISYWTTQGEIVLDPFMGSGTTAVVAKKLGRDFIGIELNPDYIKIAEKRIDLTSKPLL